MKTTSRYLFITAALLFLGACDDDFKEINKNPYAITSIDPALLFAGAQRTPVGNYTAEHTIVQQFVCPYNTGANLGFNFNEDIDLNSNPNWDGSYPTSLRSMIQALNIIGNDPTKVNLKSMIRIWKAQTFMVLVDSYGDVPYFDAGKASSGVFLPVYDDDAAIYDDLYKEIKESLAALDPAGDFVGADLFYGTNAGAAYKSTTAAVQIPKWKKLGNSLLLRLGMRYSKINSGKAQAIVAEAFAGGVMTSNNDNATVKYNGTTFVEADNNNLRNFSSFNYVAEPFADQMRLTNDPRSKNIIGLFTDPGVVNSFSPTNPNTDVTQQFGVPIGKTDAYCASIPAGGRGTRGAGLNYSQFHTNIIASPAAPEYWVTYAQTSLLLAEAAVKGWVPGSHVQAQIYYEAGIKADMDNMATYPNAIPITTGDFNTYKAQVGVAYVAIDAIKLINTQYWIASVRNGSEAFANFRRTNFPTLVPNNANNNLAGGFARRLSYPNIEASANTANYQAAAGAIGGDVLTSKVFWDN